MKSGYEAVLVALFTVAAVFFINATAGATDLWADCFSSCHADREAVKRFENGETVSVYVNQDKYRDSVHGAMPCSECHQGFAGKQHPQARYRSRDQFVIRTSLVCRRCHEPGKASAIHQRMIEDRAGEPHPCTNCHQAHSMKPVTGIAIRREAPYCLNCHAVGVSVNFRNGEALHGAVDLDHLKESVHRNLTCSDCHFGFSSSRHPERRFKSRRDFSIASADVCRRCHFDKYTKSMECIHYKVLSQGNSVAPVCTDCHGSHTVKSFRHDKVLIARRCRNCHPAIFETYVRSVHGGALFDRRNTDVPVCVDCHTAHDIRDPTTLEYHERIPELCSRCHEDEAVMARYGISTEVVTSYLADFHGITLSLYKKQRERFDRPARLVAVCTDCHGSHDISAMRKMDSELVKRKLLKRCQECHPDATENFPDTWLSHYQPSLKKAPLVYVMNGLYRLFVPLLLVGLVLQVLLHLWRYIVRR